jgi:O-acetyl-ADP-ribose deacetylase (regulator of RNase III)
MIIVKGDAACPKGDGVKIICHVCNDIGAWGAGFVLAVSKRWMKPEQKYLRWYIDNETFALGMVQLVHVEENLYVANMIAQNGIGKRSGGIPLDYNALETCLGKLAEKAKEKNASVHMPKIGCGLAGGDWETVSGIIERTLAKAGVDVTVYVTV